VFRVQGISRCYNHHEPRRAKHNRGEFGGSAAAEVERAAVPTQHDRWPTGFGLLAG